MNLIKVQNELRSVPDEALVGYVQNPQPHVPSYLALSELQRRQEMREKYQGQAQQPDTSVAEDVVQKETMPQGGLAAMMGSAQPQQPMPAPEMPEETMMAQAPMQQPTMMAEGGLASLPVDDDLYPEEFAGGGMVAFSDGGDVPGYAQGTYIPPVSYDPASQYRNARQFEVDRALKEKYAPSAQGLFGGTDLLDLVAREGQERAAAEKAGVVTPYDAAIKYYGANSPEGQTLMMRRAAWISGRPDPFTGAQPVGSAKNVRGEGETGGRPVARQEAAPKKEEAKPTTAPRVNVATDKVVFPEQKEKGIADYAKELQDFLGVDPARAGQEERLKKLEGETQRQKDVAPWMALTEAGLAMAAGSSPFAMQNIGSGALMGVKAYGTAQREYQSQLEKLNSLRNDIAKADRAEKVAIGKFGADSKQAYEERVAKEKLLDKEMAARYRIAQLQELGDDRRAAMVLMGKTAEKQPTLTEKINLEKYLDEQMPAIQERAKQGLGGNADKPGSRNYNEYQRRIQEERNKIARGFSGGVSVSNPSLVYDPTTKTIR